MSADLLRRAAVKLREAATAATPGPWQTDYRSIRDAKGEFVVASVAARANWPSDADADYIALMHPPVALALAVVLDKAAEAFELAEAEGWEPNETEGAPFVALARAVLREEAS